MPPRIQQVTPTQPPLRANANGAKSVASVIDRIAPVKKTNLGRLKFLVYGTSGTGKTRFACTFPKPLLLIGAEDGTASIVGMKDVDFVQIESTSEFHELIEGPCKSGQYRSVVLDTATKLRDLRMGEILGKKGPLLSGSWDYKKQYGQCAVEMKVMLNPFLDLARTHEVNVLILAQEANLTQDDGSGSEILRPNIASATGKSVADYISAECDYVAQTFIRDVKEKKEIRVGDLVSTQDVRVGSEYVLRIGPDAVYRTKFRRSIDCKYPLPDFVVDPSYEKMVKLIQGEKL